MLLHVFSKHFTLYQKSVFYLITLNCIEILGRINGAQVVENARVRNRNILCLPKGMLSQMFIIGPISDVTNVIMRQGHLSSDTSYQCFHFNMKHSLAIGPLCNQRLEGIRRDDESQTLKLAVLQLPVSTENVLQLPVSQKVSVTQ